MQERERLIDTLSVRRPQPHNKNSQKEREREKQWNIKRERPAQAMKKARALVLKPASPTPSNTGSTRSFHKVLREK